LPPSVDLSTSLISTLTPGEESLPPNQSRVAFVIAAGSLNGSADWRAEISCGIANPRTAGNMMATTNVLQDEVFIETEDYNKNIEFAGGLFERERTQRTRAHVYPARLALAAVTRKTTRLPSAFAARTIVARVTEELAGSRSRSS
jgi:hypothetical protein